MKNSSHRLYGVLKICNQWQISSRLY